MTPHFAHVLVLDATEGNFWYSSLLTAHQLGALLTAMEDQDSIHFPILGGGTIDIPVEDINDFYVETFFNDADDETVEEYITAEYIM